MSFEYRRRWIGRVSREDNAITRATRFMNRHEGDPECLEVRRSTGPIALQKPFTHATTRLT
jgi:hypothetical protein